MGKFFKWLKKYFIPHHENDYKPHFLRHKAMLVVFCAVIVIELGLMSQVFIVFSKTNFLASVLPGVLESITNQERADNNAPPLTESTLLTQAAQLKANDMATKGYFAHTSPEGKTPWYWFDKVGYRYAYAGENLAVNFFESEDVAQAWMNSPTHRANIVKKDYKEIGIGVASGIYQGHNTVFVAQLFGTPVKITPITTTTVTSTPKTTPTKVTTASPTKKPTVVAAAPVPIKTEVLGELTNTPSSSTAASNEKQSFNDIRTFIQKVLTSPRQSSMYAYILIALFVILALLLTIFIRYEIQHPASIMRGLGLIAIIIVIVILNMKMFSNDTKVPRDATPNNTSASLIDAIAE